MRRLWAFPLLITLLLAATLPGQGAGRAGDVTPAARKQQILFLSSYHLGLPAPDGVALGVLSAVREGGVSVGDLYYENLDLIRHSSAEYRANLIRLLRQKLIGNPIGIIIAEGPPAIEFMAEEGADLFPDVPLLTLITPDATAADAGGRQTMTMPWRADPAGTLRAALRQFPKTRHILVITGAKDGVLPFLDEAREVFASWEGQLKFEYTDTITYEEMLRRVSSLPADSVIIYAPYFMDVTGRPFIPAEVVVAVRQAAAVPIFGTQDTFLGHGIIGGSLIKTDLLGRQAGKIALDYLNGRIKLNKPVTRFAIPTAMMFDWRELTRWEGAPERLPEGSIIINRPVTLWGQYKGIVIVAATAFLSLTVLSTVLLLLNRRLKRMRTSASESEARFRAMVEYAPEALILYDVGLGRIIDANVKTEQLFACSREKLLQGGPERFYSPHQPDGLPLAESMNDHSQCALAGNEVAFQRIILAEDGKTLTCEVRVVRLLHGEKQLVRASFIDITERKQAEKELHDKNVALERSNADLEQFAYVASHDLQTPLRNIVRYAQLLARRYEGQLDADADEFIGFIVDSGKHMTQLICDLLEFSRVSHQAEPLHQIPAGETVAQALNCLGQDLHKVNAEVRVGDLPLVMAEQSHLVSLFQNLLGNAIKYRAPDRGLILSVSAEQESSSMWRFAVADNGIGIEPAYYDKIFEIFQRLDPASEVKGTGVGLTLCRRIVLRFGGAIWVESEPGTGTTFFFTLRDGSAGRLDPHSGKGPAPSDYRRKAASVGF